MADGTAQQCGRVGSRHIYFKTLQVYLKGFLLPITQRNPSHAIPVRSLADNPPAGGRMVLLGQCGSPAESGMGVPK